MYTPLDELIWPTPPLPSDQVTPLDRAVVLAKLVDAVGDERLRASRKHRDVRRAHRDARERVGHGDRMRLAGGGLAVAVVDRERDRVSAGLGEVDRGRGGGVVGEPGVAARRRRDRPGVGQIAHRVGVAVVADRGRKAGARARHRAAVGRDAADVRGVVVGRDGIGRLAVRRGAAIAIDGEDAEGITPAAARHGDVARGCRSEIEVAAAHRNPPPVRFVLALDAIAYRAAGRGPREADHLIRVARRKAPRGLGHYPSRLRPWLRRATGYSRNRPRRGNNSVEASYVPSTDTGSGTAPRPGRSPPMRPPPNRRILHRPTAAPNSRFDRRVVGPGDVDLVAADGAGCNARRRLQQRGPEGGVAVGGGAGGA